MNKRKLKLARASTHRIDDCGLCVLLILWAGMVAEVATDWSGTSIASAVAIGCVAVISWFVFGRK